MKTDIVTTPSPVILLSSHFFKMNGAARTTNNEEPGHICARCISWFKCDGYDVDGATLPSVDGHTNDICKCNKHLFTHDGTKPARLAARIEYYCDDECLDEAMEDLQMEDGYDYNIGKVRLPKHGFNFKEPEEKFAVITIMPWKVDIKTSVPANQVPVDAIMEPQTRAYLPLTLTPKRTCNLSVCICLDKDCKPEL